jgi:hypothetical protein
MVLNPPLQARLKPFFGLYKPAPPLPFSIPFPEDLCHLGPFSPQVLPFLPSEVGEPRGRGESREGMLEGQMRGQMRDPAAGCSATGCCPAMLPRQRAAALTLEGGGLEEEGKGLAWL